MNIYIGGEGSAVGLKNLIYTTLNDQGYKVFDLSEKSTSEYGASYWVGKAVSEDDSSRGIVLCGNGFGAQHIVSLHKGIRSINCVSVSQAKSGRIINDANILALGARLLNDSVALNIVETFLNTEFASGLDEDKKSHLINSFERIESLREELSKQR